MKNAFTWEREGSCWLKDIIHIISFESISERYISKSFLEPIVQSVRKDVIDTFWRATTKETYYITSIVPGQKWKGTQSYLHMAKRRKFVTANLCQFSTVEVMADMICINNAFIRPKQAVNRNVLIFSEQTQSYASTNLYYCIEFPN